MCPSHFVSMAVRKIIKSSLITTPSTWPHWEEQNVGVGLPCLTLGGAKGRGGVATPSIWPHWEEQKVCVCVWGGGGGGHHMPFFIRG